VSGERVLKQQVYRAWMALSFSTMRMGQGNDEFYWGGGILKLQAQL